MRLACKPFTGCSLRLLVPVGRDDGAAECEVPLQTPTDSEGWRSHWVGELPLGLMGMVECGAEEDFGWSWGRAAEKLGVE